MELNNIIYGFIIIIVTYICTTIISAIISKIVLLLTKLHLNIIEGLWKELGYYSNDLNEIEYIPLFEKVLESYCILNDYDDSKIEILESGKFDFQLKCRTPIMGTNANVLFIIPFINMFVALWSIKQFINIYKVQVYITKLNLIKKEKEKTTNKVKYKHMNNVLEFLDNEKISEVIKSCNLNCVNYYDKSKFVKNSEIIQSVSQDFITYSYDVICSKKDNDYKNRLIIELLSNYDKVFVSELERLQRIEEASIDKDYNDLLLLIGDDNTLKGDV